MNYRLDLGSEPVNSGVQKALAWRAEIIAPAKLPHVEADCDNVRSSRMPQTDLARTFALDQHAFRPVRTLTCPNDP
jgi:hypothetical protein